MTTLTNNLYQVFVSVEDDPAAEDYTVVVAASDAKDARRMAKDAAIDQYNAEAGGWSSAPKAIVRSCKRLSPPWRGVILAGRVSR